MLTLISKMPQLHLIEQSEPESSKLGYFESPPTQRLQCFVCSNSISATENKILGNVEKICERFYRLASRYLNIDCEAMGNKPDKTLKSHFQNPKCLVTEELLGNFCCDECFPEVESFCQIYEQWSYLQLQLNVRAEVIGHIIKKSKSKQFPHNIPVVDSFRKMFVEKVSSNPKNFPRLRLTKYDQKRDVHKERPVFVRILLQNETMQDEDDTVVTENSTTLWNPSDDIHDTESRHGNGDILPSNPRQSENLPTEGKSSHSHKPHKCSICGARFRVPWLLKAHMRGVHHYHVDHLKQQQEKSSKFSKIVPDCNIRVKTEKGGDVVIHRLKNKIGSFPCHLCEKKFKRKDHVTRHVREVHQNVKRNRLYPDHIKKSNMTRKSQQQQKNNKKNSKEKGFSRTVIKVKVKSEMINDDVADSNDESTMQAEINSECQTKSNEEIADDESHAEVKFKLESMELP